MPSRKSVFCKQTFKIRKNFFFLFLYFTRKNNEQKRLVIPSKNKVMGVAGEDKFLAGNNIKKLITEAVIATPPPIRNLRKLFLVLWSGYLPLKEAIISV